MSWIMGKLETLLFPLVVPLVSKRLGAWVRHIVGWVGAYLVGQEVATAEESANLMAHLEELLMGGGMMLISLIASLVEKSKR